MRTSEEWASTPRHDSGLAWYAREAGLTEGGALMKLNRPATGTWLVAVALGVVGLLLRFHVLHVSGLWIDPFWFVTVAFLLLAISPIAKGL